MVTGLAPAAGVRASRVGLAGRLRQRRSAGGTSRFRTRRHVGIAMMTAEDFRTGTRRRPGRDRRAGDWGHSRWAGPRSGVATPHAWSTPGARPPGSGWCSTPTMPAGLAGRGAGPGRRPADARTSTWSDWVLATLVPGLDLDGRYVQYAVHLSADGAGAA